ncbi:MAG TPA: lysozyme family protein [Bacillales bacterium]|nr:lysozyme family protein [Bacillales bacterium]
MVPKTDAAKRTKLRIWMAVLFVVLITGGIVTNRSHHLLFHYKGFSDQVKQYRPLIKKNLAKYGLENYTPVLMAVMEQESGGTGGDPMQASESAGLPANAIDDPKRSIVQGVKHFRHVLAYGKRKHVDFATIIQAYNMGPGYIHYVAEHGGKHSESLAKQFSLLQVHRHPELYDCGGNRNNFRYPYCYGDYTYSSKVMKDLHVYRGEKTSDDTF